MADEKADLFDAHRSHLRAVGYRMLGSFGEADDAVQDAWFRFAKADVSQIANVGGWLTTVVSRICLDRIRQRRAHPQESLDVFVPDPIVTSADGGDPEGTAVLSDSVGFALLVVLSTLPPLERLAFVLHDSFGVPFDDIAPVVGRSVDATRQLASRARRRVQDTPALAVDAYAPAASGSSSRRGPLRRRVATSTACCSCSIQTWCCGSTPAVPRHRGDWSAPRRSPTGRARSGDRARRRRAWCSSTARQGS